MSEKELAKHLLNAVWNEDLRDLYQILEEGADPNWIFNGYPILLHAVFLENETMVMMLIEYGAKCKGEALGFALDRGIGKLVTPLAYLGVIPKLYKTRKIFGKYPHRYAPLDYYQERRV